MWGNRKEGRVLKNWWFWTAVLEKPLESHLDCKEMKPLNSKGQQPWILIGRTDAETEAPILWPPDSKSQLIGKDSDVGKDWRQEEKEMASLTQWTWVWWNSGSWQWIGRPVVLQSTGSQRVWHDWVTEMCSNQSYFPSFPFFLVPSLSLSFSLSFLSLFLSIC